VTYAYSTTVPVARMHLAGFDVRHVGWGLGRSGNTDFQAASFLAVAAVHLVNARFVTLVDVGVRHAGGMGVWVEGGSANVSLARSLVADVGAGALRVGRGKPLSDEPLGSVTANVSALNCKFLNGSMVWHGGNGVLLQNSPFFTLRRCEVAFFKHCAVTLGWVWGFGEPGAPPATRGNVVERNHVHHAGLVRPLARGNKCLLVFVFLL
jgi:hypothetical protein